MTTRAKSLSLSGWGRTPVERCDVYRPERRADLMAILRSGGQPSFIPRGLGRSYGDAALNADAGVLSTVRMDRMLDFDPDTGSLHCEAGVPLGDIIETFLPRGYFLPVTPGTRHVTVGGALAADVHGKNHHADGTISGFVDEIELLTGRGEVLRCSRARESEVFHATLGGMGLTGVILTARLRLRPVETAYVRVDYTRAPNLDAALEGLAARDSGYRYSVAWVDCLARGDSAGRAVLMLANDVGRSAAPAAAPDLLAPRRRRRVQSPPWVPPGALNRLTVRAFNSLYYRRHPAAGARVVDYDAFFYPLDRVAGWNRLYGPRGFIQYQTVIPGDDNRAAVLALLDAARAAGQPGFLAVLKRFGAAARGPLSFPVHGVTLSLDLPMRRGTPALVRELDAITLRHGGRVYLAKDALLDPDRFRAMYPAADAFRALKRDLDPRGLFSSSLARRVGLA